MVSRFTLIFWRWVVTFHDRLHDVRDKSLLDEWFEQPKQDPDNWTYTSPSVHYHGVNRRKDD